MNIFLKVTQKNGKPLFQVGTERPLPFIEEIYNLDEDNINECAPGIYFCEPRQLPRWWKDENTEIRVVKPLGKIITISKGYRTNKLEHIKLLDKEELEKLEKAYGFNWENRKQVNGEYVTQVAGVNSTQIAGNGAIQTAGGHTTQIAKNNSIQNAGWFSTQIAGREATQISRQYSLQKSGDYSTQIIYGDHSFIILDGINVITRQIYLGDGERISKIIDHNKLFKKYKKGDKLEIIQGKVKLSKEEK